MMKPMGGFVFVNYKCMLMYATENKGVCLCVCVCVCVCACALTVLDVGGAEGLVSETISWMAKRSLRRCRGLLMPISLWISVSDRADMIAPLFTLARQAATYHAGIPSHSFEHTHCSMIKHVYKNLSTKIDFCSIVQASTQDGAIALCLMINVNRSVLTTNKQTWILAKSPSLLHIHRRTFNFFKPEAENIQTTSLNR